MIRRLRQSVAAAALSTTLVVLSAAVSAPASAHDVWLVTHGEPVDHVQVGELVRVELRQGHLDSVEELARNDRKLLRLEALAPDDQRTVLPGLHGNMTVGVLRPDQPGLWAIGYEGSEALYTLPAERFEKYLKDEGLEHVLEARKREQRTGEEGRELVSRSLKMLLSVGDGPNAADRRMGLPAEMVIESIHNGEISIRLWRDEEPAVDVLIDLKRRGSDASDEVFSAGRTDTEGRVTLSVGDGHWLAAAVLAEALDPSEDNGREARWRTHFTTLTFSSSHH